MHDPVKPFCLSFPIPQSHLLRIHKTDSLCFALDFPFRELKIGLSKTKSSFKVLIFLLSGVQTQESRKSKIFQMSVSLNTRKRSRVPSNRCRICYFPAQSVISCLSRNTNCCERIRLVPDDETIWVFTSRCSCVEMFCTVGTGRIFNKQCSGETALSETNDESTWELIQTIYFASAQSKALAFWFIWTWRKVEWFSSKHYILSSGHTQQITLRCHSEL